MSQESKPDLSAIRRELPPYLSRKHPRFRELTGYSARSMANLDCIGQGPKVRIMLGGAVCYERDSLIAWLEERARLLPERKGPCHD